MNQFISVLVTAMLPISELRGAIPLALGAYHWPIWQAFLVAVVGNMIPVILILFFLDSVSKFLSQHSKFFKNFFDKLFEHTRNKHNDKFEKWGALALISFVAIPLPFTGAWTGALAGFLFGIEIKKAMPLIFIGILIAGVIVTLISTGVITFI